MHIWSGLAREEVRVGRMAEWPHLNECQARCATQRRRAGSGVKNGLTRTRTRPQVRNGQAVCAEDAYMYLYSTHAAVYQRRGFSFLALCDHRL